MLFYRFSGSSSLGYLEGMSEMRLKSSLSLRGLALGLFFISVLIMGDDENSCM